MSRFKDHIRLPPPSGTPVVLYASASIKLGGSAQPNSSLLLPPVERPMMVHDINFMVQSPSSASLGAYFNFYTLPFFRAQMNLGRHAVTDGFIPLGNFSPRYSYRYNDTTVFGPTDALVAGSAEIYNHRRWILPRPMYMAPGESLRVTYNGVNPLPTTFPSTVASGTWKVGISIHGLLLTKPLGSTTRCVPYVSAFVPDRAQLRSGELDLRNALDKPLTVQRLVGELWRAGNTSSRNICPYDAPGANVAWPAVQPVKIRIENSMGKYVITNSGQQSSAANFVDWQSVFPPQEPLFPFGRTLDPGERLQVQYDVGSLYLEQDTAPPSIPPYNVSQLAYVSLVGHREEPLDA